MWILFAMLGGASKALTGLFRKKLSNQMSGDVFIWINFMLFIPLLLLIGLYADIDLFTIFRNNLWQVLLASGSWTLALVFNLRALKTEQLSYIAPLAAFIPIFTLALAWVVLGESPPVQGIVGIAIVFIGAYVVNLSPSKHKWYDPLRNIAANPGSRYALAMAFLFGVATVTSKSIVDQGYSSMTWQFALVIANLTFLLHVPLTKRAEIKAALKTNKRIIGLAALTSFGAAIFGIIALQGPFASYVISVRRLDIIFSVLLGWKVLKESSIRIKIIGSSIMMIGIVILALF